MNTVLHNQQNRQQLNQTSQTNSDCSVFEQYLKDSGKVKLAIINTLIHCINVFRFCAPSHAFIAEKAHASPDYTQEVISEAKALGFIKYIRRFNNSNVYSLPDDIKNDQSLHSRICGYLPALRGYLCLSLLLSVVTSNKTAKKLPISIIPEVTNSIFDSQSNDLMEKPVLKEEINEDLTISYSNNRELLYRRQAIVELVSQQRITTRFLYPHLCDSMRFLAIQMGLTPYKSCYLAFIPEHIANEALQFYQYTQLKNQIPKNKAKFIGSVIKDLLLKNEMSFDYSFINTLSSEFGMDKTWLVMTPFEKSVLEQAISYIGRRVEVKQELQREQRKPVSSGPSQSAIQSEKERIARLRSNPYSQYYTGPSSGTDRFSSPLKDKHLKDKHSSDLKPQSSFLNSDPTSKGNYGGVSKASINKPQDFNSKTCNTPRNPPVAPPPPRAQTEGEKRAIRETLELAQSMGFIVNFETGSITPPDKI